MLLATPSKKACTDELRSDIDASNTHRDSIVPEDLTIALQNLGSRVRKSVTEGYNTQNFATFTVPATPCSSPAKLSSTQITPTPIFRSANDAFNLVFPPGCPRLPTTPSPKKHRRQEELDDDELHRIRDSDVDMGGESEIDEDQVMVILEPDANSNMSSIPRKIKPLRRSMVQSRSGGVLLDPFLSTPQDRGPCSPSLDAVQSGGLEMVISEETTD